MNKRILLLISLSFLILQNINGQLDKFNTINLHPVSPTAFQFLKYTEMPVSEYTGIPNISIPLYQINVDEVNIPLDLTYHASGIRVSQESSWVGLGWDLAMGSIIQTINDKDDYGSDAFGAFVKRRPDFFGAGGDGSPTTLPLYLLDPSPSSHGTGWSNPYSINSPAAQQGFAIATNNYVPVAGAFNQLESNLFASSRYDSEPDIFVASFMGHTVKFILNFLNSPSSSSIVVLNKQGYQVTKTTDGFSIVTPDGTTYFFELKSTIASNTTSKGLDGVSGSSNSGHDATSFVFLLTKIITVKGKIVLVDYWQTDEYVSYPNCTSKLQALTNDASNTDHPMPAGYGTYTFANIDSRPSGAFLGAGTYNSYSTNSETYYYLKSITFPNGRVDFPVSSRTDITGAKKLDSVIVKNSNNLIIKSWQLNYSNFDASSIGGNFHGYSDTDTTLKAETRSSQRLKLTSVAESSGETYNFSYNTTQLPKKNSYATDYWGFYNNQTSNSSFAPNPNVLNLSSLGNNGNSKNADLQYAKACVLEGIQYPTGGKATFEYELNEFDKSQMIGLVTDSQIVQGNGLRIHAINHYTDTASSATRSLRTVYSYSSGKLIASQQIVRQLNYKKLTGFTLDGITTVTYTLTEITANGVFSSSPLSSINGIGYTTVTRQELDGNNVAKGKTVTEFYNNVDIQNPTIASRAMNCSVLVLKSIINPDNGSFKTVKIFDDSNRLLRSTSQSYSVIASDIYYGARIMSYGSLYYGINNSGSLSEQQMPQYIIGYFPIYDIETLPDTARTVEFDENGDSLINNVISYFDGFNLLAETLTTNSNDLTQVQYAHPYDYPSVPGDSLLFLKHRLTEVVGITKYKRDLNYGNSRQIASYQKQYVSTLGNVVESQLSIDNHPASNPLPEITTYDEYDSSGNLLQLTKSGEVNSFIWDYNGEYIVAEIKNADIYPIAYSSFEADGTGSWNSSGTPVVDSSAPTGVKCYYLTDSTTLENDYDLPNGDYIVSYWSKNGQYTVGGTVSSKQGPTINGWTYYEHAIHRHFALEISGTGYIDEVRLYPKGALMTTYTYQPLVGITSQCDINNRITYYEYDSFNRLKLIRDQDKNITKTFDYKYKEQQ